MWDGLHVSYIVTQSDFSHCREKGGGGGFSVRGSVNVGPLLGLGVTPPAILVFMFIQLIGLERGVAVIHYKRVVPRKLPQD